MEGFGVALVGSSVFYKFLLFFVYEFQKFPLRGNCFCNLLFSKQHELSYGSFVARNSCPPRPPNQGRVRSRLPHVGQHGQPSEAFESSRVDLKRDRWIQNQEC